MDGERQKGSDRDRERGWDRKFVIVMTVLE